MGGSLGEAGAAGPRGERAHPDYRVGPTSSRWSELGRSQGVRGQRTEGGPRAREQGQREQLRTRGHRVPLDPHRSTAWDTGTPGPPEEGPGGLHTHCTGSWARVARPEAPSKRGRCRDAAPTPCQEWASAGASARANWLQFSSVAQSCPTLCDPMDCSTPDLPVHHRSLLKFMSIESVMPSNRLILCRPLLLPSIFPSIKVFSNESAQFIRCPEYWFSFRQHQSFQ